MFNETKWLYKSKSISELMEITSLSKNEANEVIPIIENCESSDPKFENSDKKLGRKKWTRTTWVGKMSLMRILV